MIAELLFITTNPSKANQLRLHLNFPVTHKSIDLPEIQSLNLKEVVKHKAQAAYNLTKKPILVEDTALTFSALGQLPGPLIKWFLKELGNDGLCKIITHYQDKTALAQVVFGLYDGNNLELFDAYKKGSISDYPRGVDGFGWDPVFIPEGYNKTWGEMTTEEQIQTSMRRIALKKLEKYLKSQ